MANTSYKKIIIDIKVFKISGGEKINTIPTKANAEILVPVDKVENVLK